MNDDMCLGSRRGPSKRPHDWYSQSHYIWLTSVPSLEEDIWILPKLMKRERIQLIISVWRWTDHQHFIRLSNLLLTLKSITKSEWKRRRPSLVSSAAQTFVCWTERLKNKSLFFTVFNYVLWKYLHVIKYLSQHGEIKQIKKIIPHSHYPCCR